MFEETGEDTKDILNCCWTTPPTSMESECGEDISTIAVLIIFVS